jgi:Mn2+/Fe2+ NRAMP family transporter
MTATKNLPVQKVEKSKGFKFLKRSFAVLGPGLITGAADDDPSGISTYSVAGAAYGYATLWIALLTFPLMAAIQLMCARLGMVTRSRPNSFRSKKSRLEHRRHLPEHPVTTSCIL